ncbi:unnamed protein product [Moneuplotes crassus]|uniref:EF-hand domain-containing protein n=1 Tax=Euplotes crassus TaxID=5936 RepID=A0AAD1XYX7_EUPCR|nr:unnamed protein product [Moneuplotes crassus]
MDKDNGKILVAYKLLKMLIFEGNHIMKYFGYLYSTNYLCQYFLLKNFNSFLKITQKFTLLEKQNLTSKISVSEKLIERLKETFKLYSEDKGGYITQEQLGTIMRSHNQSPTEESLQEIIENLNLLMN